MGPRGGGPGPFFAASRSFSLARLLTPPPQGKSASMRLIASQARQAVQHVQGGVGLAAPRPAYDEHVEEHAVGGEGPAHSRSADRSLSGSDARSGLVPFFCYVCCLIEDRAPVLEYYVALRLDFFGQFHHVLLIHDARLPQLPECLREGHDVDPSRGCLSPHGPVVAEEEGHPELGHRQALAVCAPEGGPPTKLFRDGPSRPLRAWSR